MDVVDYVMAIGAKSVTAFEYRQSTIIVFAQYDTENPRVGSEVYEFKGKNAVKIQLLFTTRPTSVHHFVHNDINFILVINEFERSSLLCWAGEYISFQTFNRLIISRYHDVSWTYLKKYFLLLFNGVSVG